MAAWYLKLDNEFVYVGDGGICELRDPTQRIGFDVETRIKLNKWLWFDADLCAGARCLLRHRGRGRAARGVC